MARKSILRPSKLADVFSPKMLVVYAAFVLAVYVLGNGLAAAQITEDFFTEVNPGWVVSLGAQNDSKEVGTAKLVAVKNQTKVTISVTNEPTGVNQPVHIHYGSCPKPGAVVYPLNNVINGKSVTTLNVKLADLQKMEPLAINLHQSAAAIGVYVSCGNLK